MNQKRRTFSPFGGKTRGVHALSIAELMPALKNLSRSEKLQLARLLIEGLAEEDSSTQFKEGHVYPGPTH